MGSDGQVFYRELAIQGFERQPKTSDGKEWFVLSRANIVCRLNWSVGSALNANGKLVFLTAKYGSICLPDYPG